jgi:hypothetical protein
MDKVIRKPMVESLEQAAKGIKSGVLNSGYVCIRDTTFRICAPKTTDEVKMRSLIFWTKESVKDKSPSWKKCVRSCHSIEHGFDSVL